MSGALDPCVFLRNLLSKIESSESGKQLGIWLIRQHGLVEAIVREDERARRDAVERQKAGSLKRS